MAGSTTEKASAAAAVPTKRGRVAPLYPGERGGDVEELEGVIPVATAAGTVVVPFGTRWPPPRQISFHELRCAASASRMRSTSGASARYYCYHTDALVRWPRVATPDGL